MTTIFISSTAQDLAAYRKAVIDTLSRMAEVSVAMEDFGSRGEEPVEVCRDEIDRCGLFVGIYAWRYGWVPPGALQSITEQEFDYARNRKKTCLCYLVSDDQPWPPKWIEGGAAADSLKAFKQRVSALVVSRFTTPDNLASQVAADVARTLKDEDAGDRKSGLAISPLSSPGRVLPLAGRPVLPDPASGGSIYTEGCRVSFSLSHNGRGASTVMLYGMRLNVIAFSPGARQDLAYRIDGDAIHAAGSTKPHEFLVSVDGEQVSPARWVVEGSPRRFATAGSWNFFDVPQQPRITLAPTAGDVEEITGHVLVTRAGLYDLSVTFFYSVAGEDRQVETSPLRLYRAR